MNPFPIVSTLIDRPKALRVLGLAVPCLFAWLVTDSWLEHREITATASAVVSSLNAPGSGVVAQIARWLRTTGVEPILASWLPPTVGVLFVLGGTRGRPLGGGKARGSSLAWCLLVPTMIVLGSAHGTRAVVEWWLVAAVIFVLGCAIVEPRVSADSYRYWPTWLGALEQLFLGVFQALAVLGVPIIVLAGMIGDSIAPEVLSARPRPAGAVVPLQSANG